MNEDDKETALRFVTWVGLLGFAMVLALNVAWGLAFGPANWLYPLVVIPCAFAFAIAIGRLFVRLFFRLKIGSRKSKT